MVDAIITGAEGEDEVAVRMAYFLDDMFNVCSDRLAVLVNSGGGKFIIMFWVGLYIYIY